MSELKKYEVRTASGYLTTFQYSDADAKLRGLEGKDVASVRAAAQAEAEERAAEVERAARDAAEKAKEAAAQKAKEAENTKAAPAPSNKQASKPANK